MVLFHSITILLWLVLIVSSDTPNPSPATGSTGQGPNPAIGSNSQGANPATGSNGQGSNPATGSTGQGANPATGSTGQGANPATGSTDQGSKPATGSTGQDSGRVILWHDAVTEMQLSLSLRHDLKGQSVKSQENALTTPGNFRFRVLCNEYKTENPRMMVFYKGMYLDMLTLHPIEDICSKDYYSRYLTPQDPVEKGSTTKIKIKYLWAGKKPKCVERWYIVTKGSLKGRVERSDYPVVKCPKHVDTFIKQFGTGLEAGGIVSVGPMGVTTCANAGNGKRQPRVKLEIRKDFKGKSIVLNCDKIILKTPDENGRTERILAHISHDDYDVFPVDHFQLESCKKDSINVNRRIVGDGVNIFKLLFKAVDDKCYERSVYMYRFLYFYYYDTVATIRETPLEVECPSVFAEDVGMNVKAPWFMRMYQKEDVFETEIKGTTPDPWVN